MTFRPVRSWAETTRYAEAMEDIIELMEGYLAPESGISREAVVSEIIGIIETKAGHQFLTALQWQPDVRRGTEYPIRALRPGYQGGSMATNKPAGDGHRNGAVKKRTQLTTKIMGEEHYTKRSKTSGAFMAQKKDDGKFKGVRKER